MNDQEDNDGISSDDALWAAVTRDVKPLKGRKSPKLPTPKHSQKTSHPPRVVEHVSLPPKTPKQPQGNEVDRNTLRRFKRGEMALDARLDLHGMNQGEAHEALKRFILSSYAAGHRCVIVITGKGRTGKTSDEFFDYEPGVLKRRVPEWLDDPSLKPYILQISDAQPRHGGAGALYVLLRRKRDV